MKKSSPLVFSLLLCLAALPAHAQSAGPTSQQLRTRLQDILSQPEFRKQQGHDLHIQRIVDTLHKKFASVFHWFDKMWRKLVSFLNKLFNFHQASGVNSSVSRTLVYLLVAALLVAGVFLLVRVLKQQVRRQGKKTQENLLQLQEEETPDTIEPDEWEQRAAAFASRGDWRAAYRALFTGMLFRLHREGCLRFQRGSTNGEYLRQLRKNRHAALADAMKLWMQDFDLRYYGARPVAEADWQRARAWHEAAVQILPSLFSEAA